MKFSAACVLCLSLMACASGPSPAPPAVATLRSVSVHGPDLQLDWTLALRDFVGRPVHQRALADIEATVATAYEWADWREVLAVAEPVPDEAGTLRVTVYGQPPLALPRPAAEWIVPPDDAPPAPFAAGGARAETMLDATLGQWLQTASRVLIDGSERRLYLRRADGKVVSYAVAVGTARTPTPAGHYAVEALHQHPTWYPPASIRRSYAARGKTLPASVPPGPSNPLGEWFVRLQHTGDTASVGGIGIHGTNQPGSIGRAVSHGCIRMHDRDVAELVRQLRPGDGVTVVRSRAALLAGR